MIFDASLNEFVNVITYTIQVDYYPYEKDFKDLLKEQNNVSTSNYLQV